MPRPDNEPKAAVVEEMCRSLRNDSVNDGAAGPDGWVAHDVVEGHVSDRRVQVSEADLRVRDRVRGDVLSGQGHRSLVHVRQDDVTAFVQAGGHDSDGAVAASEIQD